MLKTNRTTDSLPVPETTDRLLMAMQFIPKTANNPKYILPSNPIANASLILIDSSHELDAEYNLDSKIQAIVEQSFADRRKLIMQKQTTSADINIKYPFVERSPELVGILSMVGFHISNNTGFS